MMRRMLYLVFVMTFCSSTGCSRRIESFRSERVIPRDSIRTCHLLDFRSTGDSSLVPVGSLDVRRSADAQAREWDPAARLICLRPSAFFVQKGSVWPKLWVFVYKNGAEDAWLGVLVGHAGVLDAATRRLYDERLKRWPELPTWTADYDSSVFASGEDLVAVPLGSTVIPVWRLQRVSYYYGGGSRSETTFVHGLTRRELQGDTIGTIARDLAARSWAW